MIDRQKLYVCIPLVWGLLTELGDCYIKIAGALQRQAQTDLEIFSVHHVSTGRIPVTQISLLSSIPWLFLLC